VTTRSRPDRTLRTGARITQSLELVRPLGAGGMGSVWIARHHGLQTNVVVKFISDVLADNGEAIARFQREAAAAAEVRSPHVVQMLDHGVSAEGVPYIAMELLEGMSLRERLDRGGPLAASEVATIVAQCAKALTRAHERGLVHRDIKPDNIFLTDAGDGEVFAKVLDFGIAKSSAPSMIATNTGALLGSPYYMSPEQVLGSKAVDARSDIWALGVTAFEALTARRPFEAETIGALSIAICHGPMPVPSQLNPALPPTFDAWFARACSRELATRFATVKELSEALNRAVADVHAVAATPPVVAANGRTLPMSTTAGIGVETAPIAKATRSRLPPLAIAITVGLLSLGALGALGVLLAARNTGRDQPAAVEAPPESTKPAAKAPKSAAPKAEPPAADTVEELLLAPAPSSSATSKPSPTTKPTAKKPGDSAASALTTAPLPTPVKPPPKVEHDPNIF